MEKQNCTNTMLCWNPGGDVELFPLGDTRADKYDMSSLATYRHIQQGSFEHRKTMVFIEGMKLIIRDGCDPQKVHKALLGLEEYRDGLPDDVPGVYELRKKFGEE
jgi:hypothetical protein